MRVESSDELEVFEEVGRGGFGVVYRGIIKSSQEEVAIKQIDLEQDATDLIEINKEIQIMSECRSPQITSYYGSFVKNYKLWVVMEFVDGGSIFELLKAGTIDETTISIIVLDIVSALNYLHNQGKIHRDLKSQNILINKHGEIKLTDFGVSTQLSSSFSKRNTTVGTPYWMAPEVILNSNGGHSFKADIWSLGCCCYEMFTGKPPLQNHYAPMKALRKISQCEQNGDFIKMIELDKLEISDEFRDFLKSCFIEDAKIRYNGKKLIKHKFLNRKISNSRKFVKKLITRKQLWNQENQSIRKQNFYVPTNIYRNQVQWNGEGTGTMDKMGVQFDISLIEEEEEEEEKENEQKKVDEKEDVQKKVEEKEVEQRKEEEKEDEQRKEEEKGDEQAAVEEEEEEEEEEEAPIQTTTTSLLTRNVCEQFYKGILNKSLIKLDARLNLTKNQRDQIARLNKDMMSLIFEKDNKIVLFQFLRIVFKELSKERNQSLGKLILPSSLKNRDLRDSPWSNTASVATSTMNAAAAQFEAKDELVWPSRFDEIEKSLMDSWIKRMKEAH
ncbi:hypothetical protein KGF56_002999 [Candida oxycetoniae]|uniref:non-specific serine/threonine protein kinase n=1 Tax=Candida oxycetoniae TaxID=497107 RepID=A0AAI9SW83_9ASCO|nr:uncharacterized protein KGF56_002999 [Candida oxycetoniae]KAI3404238.2 hypothetical protein KGF56_002999 [Candida oxycetoniae]